VNLLYFINSLAKKLGLDMMGFKLEDIDFLKDMEGICLSLVPTAESPLYNIDGIWLQLQNDDAFYVEVESIVCFKDDVGEKNIIMNT